MHSHLIGGIQNSYVSLLKNSERNIDNGGLSDTVYPLFDIFSSDVVAFLANSSMFFTKLRVRMANGCLTLYTDEAR